MNNSNSYARTTLKDIPFSGLLVKFFCVDIGASL